MRKQIGMFISCQIFFMCLFSLVAMQSANYVGLQPLDSKHETVNVTLNEDAYVSDIRNIAHTNKLNLAYLNREQNIYYIDFSLIDNPTHIYGVDSNRFVNQNFQGNICASTDINKACKIQLSSPNKAKSVTIYPLDQLDDDFFVNNVILYPSIFHTKEMNVQAFLKLYPNASFLANRGINDGLFPILIIVFLFCNVLILLSMLQHIYRKGKETGIAKMFGQSFTKRCLLPLARLMITIAIILIICYFLLYQFLTFDWSYLRYVIIYYGITFFLFSLSLSIAYISVNLQQVNLLVKGMQKSKFLTQIFVIICTISLVFSAYLITILSQDLRFLDGRYQSFNYYQHALKQSGTIPLTESAFPLFLQGDPTFSAKNKKLMEYFSDFLEYKNKSIERYLESESFFPVFYINKNLALKYFNSQINTINLENSNNVYVFTSDMTNQQNEITALAYHLSPPKGEEETNIMFVEYNNLQLKEFIAGQEHITESATVFKEIQQPIYIYDEKNEQGLIEDGPFATQYAGGFYVSLETEEAQQKWSMVTQKLEELGLSNYYKESTTLANLHQRQIDNFWYQIISTLVVVMLSIAGMLLLIQTCLQEYFRINRQQLVLKKVFGNSFVERYGIVFIGIVGTFTCTWLTGTYINKEWFLPNVGIFTFLILMLCTMIKRSIEKLEQKSINIVVKE